MIYDHLINHDTYGISNAKRPWDVYNIPRRVEKIHTNDPQEQVNRCIICPLPENEMKCGKKCWFRMGEENPKNGNKPPAGYDKEALDNAMIHAYTEKELASKLGVSLYMAKKWLKWRYK